jgi:threonyl-tRNA synthetase
VIVHRAVLGSLERFVGLLIEHFDGWFPVWLAPEQVRVLPITDEHREYGRKIKERLEDAGVRTTLDDRNEKTGYKVRSATMDKVPYMLILGDNEVEAGSVSVRSHDFGDEGEVKVSKFVDRICHEIDTKKLPEGFETASEELLPD